MSDPRPLLNRLLTGHRPGLDEAVDLARRASIHELAAAAAEVRAGLHPGRVVTYIVNTNVNYTNVCVTRCDFCAFYRRPGHDGGYLLSADEIVGRIRSAEAAGATQVLLQGGHHPRLSIEYFEDLFGATREATRVHLHALSAPEIHHYARLWRMGVEDVLGRLQAAGLETIPGGGAEVLDESTRRAISPLKCTVDDWLAVHRTAHGLGIRSSATMMFGTAADDWPERVGHLLRLADLQDETGGFTAFIAWTYQPSPGLVAPGRRSAATYLRLVALARLLLPSVATIQASPLTPPAGVVGLALDGGADDYGNVLLEEHVVAAAGVARRATEAGARAEIAEAGYEPRRRDTYYRIEAGVA